MLVVWPACYSCHCSVPDVIRDASHAALKPFPPGVTPHVVSLSVHCCRHRVCAHPVGFLVNRARPSVETEQPTADFVRASGKCAECHARLQYSVVHEYEMSAHAKKGVNCLDCHQPAAGPAEGRSPRLRDQHASDRRQLPLLPRRHLSGISCAAATRRPVGPPSTARRA